MGMCSGVVVWRPFEGRTDMAGDLPFLMEALHGVDNLAAGICPVPNQ
jgi:hypothetical protein